MFYRGSFPFKSYESALSRAGTTGEQQRYLFRFVTSATRFLPTGEKMELYRMSEVARMFDVHPNTIRKRVRTNILHPVKLPGSRYNRFALEEVNSLRRKMGLPADDIVQLYRVGQVAAMFGVHPNTVRKWMRTNILRSVRLPGSDYNQFTSSKVNRLRREMGLPPVEEPE
ncbi:MAG: hypothetical protein CEE40_05940 [Chloroflexi bacterium B3_Chlor]|nr:MAG: hypothetical protein CEE40_05940 [Chloroflexi bacterium B3_Chlor]